MERMTIALTDDQAERVKAAVAKGEYASHSEVIREALRDWELNQSLRRQSMAELKGEIVRSELTYMLDIRGQVITSLSRMNTRRS